MPRLAQAMASREIGHEAARLVVSVATPDTVEGWIARARERTVRHLREEVDAVAMLRRLAPDRSAGPPSETVMQELAAIESRVASGAAFREGASEAHDDARDGGDEAGAPDDATRDGQTSAPLAELLAGFERACGSSLGPRDARGARGIRGSGRVTLRLGVSAGTRRYYRWLERNFRRHGVRAA
jgi:hypothetical protein